MFLEAYGQVAVQNSSFSPAIDAMLETKPSNCRPPASRLAAASSTLQASAASAGSRTRPWSRASGPTTQRRYAQLLTPTASRSAEAFQRAGYRIVNDVPANDRAWTDGEKYYHWEKLYERHNVGYHGPGYNYATMPDQYMFSAAAEARARQAPPDAPCTRRSTRSRATCRGTASPTSDPVERSRQRLDLLPRADTKRTSRSLLVAPQAGAGGLRPLARVLAEHARLVHQALRQEEPREIVVGDQQPLAVVSGQPPTTMCRSRSSPMIRRC